MINIFNRPTHEFAKGFLPYEDADLDPRTVTLLNDEQIRNLPITDREYHISDRSYGSKDEDICRLFLRVRSNATKSYFVRFKNPGFGESRTKSIGSIDEVSLDEARLKAQRICDEVIQEGLPNKRRQIRRGMPLGDVFRQYLEIRRQLQSEWRKTVQSLIERHVLPRFGNAPVSALSRDHLTSFIDNLSLTQPSQANNLLKSLKAFLSWCVTYRLLDGNPLARVPLPVPPKRKSIPLSVEDLAAIYVAANALGEPWQLMIRLAILTGKSIEDVRYIQSGDIDIQSREWFQFHRADSEDWKAPKIPLNELALSLLIPHQSKTGFLFASPRRKDGSKPLFFRSDIAAKLRFASGIKGTWGMRDIHRATMLHSGLRGRNDLDAYNEWGRRIGIAAERLSSNPHGLEPLEDIAL